MQISVQKRILLFHAEPGMRRFRLGHGVEARGTVVRLGRLLVVFVSLAEHELMVPLEKWVLVKGDRVEIHVRIGPLSLVGGRTVVIPDG